MFGRKKARRQILREAAEAQRMHAQMTEGLIPPIYEAAQQQAAATAQMQPQAVVDDFLPADLRMPARDEVAGMMMPWPRPLVIDGEIRECPGCGSYRDWVIVSTRDEVWLRCRTGHQTLEPRLDAAWYNRHSTPVDSRHDTFEDGLRHLGHLDG
ncbi:hypothetical protein ACIBK8_25965 [Streptomyces sp. NPDC050161]|uniref:hypothetical protein n=1 Tax=Streptomyces sp. NPDC050161 TaxID=3365604 RepID=UPI003799F656